MIQHCQRVRPIIDLVHKVISTDLSIADCLLPITSRIYMLLQRSVSGNSAGLKSAHVPLWTALVWYLSPAEGFPVFTSLLPGGIWEENWKILGMQQVVLFILLSTVHCSPTRLTTVISRPVDVIASCVNCLTVLAARNPAKVRHQVFLTAEKRHAWCIPEDTWTFDSSFPFSGLD